MLCQLVCTDRRYARMNCFNIRELQGILKRKFFTDLVNSHDHRNLLDQTMIGLRFKTNQSSNTDLDILSFYNYGTHLTGVGKHLNLSNTAVTPSETSPTLSSFDFFFINMFRELSPVGYITPSAPALIFSNILVSYISPIFLFNLSSCFSLLSIYTSSPT
jgi:hypothetical protein